VNLELWSWLHNTQRSNERAKQVHAARLTNHRLSN